LPIDDVLEHAWTANKMAEAKTKPTAASVKQYLAAIADPQRRADCEVIAKMMRKITQQAAKMWGTGIVGFGQYKYVYESGRSGESSLTGLSARKTDISIYLVAAGAEQEALLARLGKHKIGKACLTIRQLADVNVQVLEELIADSVNEVKRRYPSSPASPSA
jgi:Domain of unknown function (DU1801)